MRKDIYFKKAGILGVGGLLILAGFFLFAVPLLRDGYAFYGTARSSTQGVVQASHEETHPCSEVCTGDEDQCSTTITFTPAGQSTSFTTTDDQCSTLEKGTQVEVLYNPDNPSQAKTTRQAEADSTGIAIRSVEVSVLLFFFLIVATVNIEIGKTPKKKQKVVPAR
jgi:hypothetical protein